MSIGDYVNCVRCGHREAPLGRSLCDGCAKQCGTFLRDYGEITVASQWETFPPGSLENGLIAKAERDYWHLDSNKSRVDLLPVRALEAVGHVFAYGMDKYGHRNWEAHADNWSWGQLVGSILRHLFAWMRNEDIDEESGEPHLAHAACNVLMLLELVLCDRGKDDRQVISDEEYQP